jgi:hypothetical protein
VDSALAEEINYKIDLTKKDLTAIIVALNFVSENAELDIYAEEVMGKVATEIDRQNKSPEEFIQNNPDLFRKKI